MVPNVGPYETGMCWKRAERVSIEREREAHYRGIERVSVGRARSIDNSIVGINRINVPCSVD